MIAGIQELSNSLPVLLQLLRKTAYNFSYVINNFYLNKWEGGIKVIHSELWDYFGYMVLVLFTGVSVFIAILPQSFPH